MDKKEEKIDQEELLEQQAKNNRNGNVWLVVFFVLLSSLTIFVFRYSEKVFYNRVNFIFKKRNAVKPKAESKWESLNSRFLIPLAKIIGFILLLLSFIIITKELILKLRECFFGSEKKGLKEVDDIRSIFFYGRDHCEVEEEITKILNFLLKISDVLTKEERKKYEKLRLVLTGTSNDCWYLYQTKQSIFIPREAIKLLVNKKPKDKGYTKELQQLIKKKFHHYYYKYMNNSSFLLKNKNFCNYKNNACISFILSFFDYLYYFLGTNSLSHKDQSRFKLKGKEEHFDEIYGKKFDFVVENIKDFFGIALLKGEIEKFTTKEKGNTICFQYFLDGCQKNFFITLEDFFDFLWRKRVEKEEEKDPSYSENVELEALFLPPKILSEQQKNNENFQSKTQNYNIVQNSNNNINDITNIKTENKDNKDDKDNLSEEHKNDDLSNSNNNIKNKNHSNNIKEDDYEEIQCVNCLNQIQGPAVTDPKNPTAADNVDNKDN